MTAAEIHRSCSREIWRQASNPEGTAAAVPGAVVQGKRALVEMRWGLVPFWWSKPLKELRLATFNARVETVTTKPFFREPFKSKRCLMPVSGYFEWQDYAGRQTALVFHSA
jgi:putative SOS response-associated peptidase YedK